MLIDYASQLIAGSSGDVSLGDSVRGIEKTGQAQELS
jgi:hypothetical protein